MKAGQFSRGKEKTKKCNYYETIASFTLFDKSRGSQPFSCHVPLQHSDRWACTPTAFQQISMYPFRISTDEHVPINFLLQNILSWLFIDIFNNKHVMTFDNNINWYVYKFLEINSMQTHFYFLLITLNVPLQIGKCTPGWEPLDNRLGKVRHINPSV